MRLFLSRPPSRSRSFRIFALAALTLVLAPAIALAPARADNTIPRAPAAPPASASSLRAIFAIQGALAIPLDCRQAGRALDRFACRDHFPPGTQLGLDDGTTVSTVGPAGAGCGGETDPFPSLRIDRAPNGAVYAVYPPTLPHDALFTEDGRPARGTHVHRWQIPRRFGDSASDAVVATRRHLATGLLWLPAGDERHAEVIAGRDDGLPIELVAAPVLDDSLDTEAELLLRVPGRKVFLVRRGRDGWRHVGGWGCRD